MGDFPSAAPAAPSNADSGRSEGEVGPGPLDRGLQTIDAGTGNRDARAPTPTTDAAPDRDRDRDRSAPDRLDGSSAPDLASGRDGTPEPEAGRPCTEAERCNGRDDDCDGHIDEGVQRDDPGVCGGYIARSCRVWLGTAVAADGPGGLADRWGRCPEADPASNGNTRCFSTGGDRQFHALVLPADQYRLDEAHHLGLRFDCEDDSVGAWVQKRCEAALAVRFVGGEDPEPEEVLPRTCDLDAVVSDEGLGCVRTGGDALFHRLRLSRTVRHNTDFAPAFFCHDPDDAQRAASTERSVELFLGLWELHDDDGVCPDLGTPLETWGGCPDDLEDDGGSQRCVGRVGGSGFGTIAPLLSVDECDAFALALRPRTARR